MPAHVGRDAVLNKNGVALAGMRALGMNFAGEPVDISSADDGPNRTLASASGTEAVDYTFEGVWKDDVLRAIALGSGSKLLTDITFDFVDGAELSGDFYLSAYSEQNPHGGEATFTATFLSSGAWTYTP